MFGLGGAGVWWQGRDLEQHRASDAERDLAQSSSMQESSSTHTSEATQAAQIELRLLLALSPYHAMDLSILAVTAESLLTEPIT